MGRKNKKAKQPRNEPPQNREDFLKAALAEMEKERGGPDPFDAGYGGYIPGLDDEDEGWDALSSHGMAPAGETKPLSVRPVQYKLRSKGEREIDWRKRDDEIDLREAEEDVQIANGQFVERMQALHAFLGKNGAEKLMPVLEAYGDLVRAQVRLQQAKDNDLAHTLGGVDPHDLEKEFMAAGARLLGVLKADPENESGADMVEAAMEAVSLTHLGGWHTILRNRKAHGLPVDEGVRI